MRSRGGNFSAKLRHSRWRPHHVTYTECRQMGLAVSAEPSSGQTPSGSWQDLDVISATTTSSSDPPHPVVASASPTLPDMIIPPSITIPAMRAPREGWAFSCSKCFKSFLFFGTWIVNMPEKCPYCKVASAYPFDRLAQTHMVDTLRKFPSQADWDDALDRVARMKERENNV